jgi:hypothetical protein
MTTKVIVKVESIHPGTKVCACLASPETGAVHEGTTKELVEPGEAEFWVHSHADLVVKEVPVAKEGG